MLVNVMSALISLTNKYEYLNLLARGVKNSIMNFTTDAPAFRSHTIVVWLLYIMYIVILPSGRKINPKMKGY
jgi:hypothetical protein